MMNFNFLNMKCRRKWLSTPFIERQVQFTLVIFKDLSDYECMIYSSSSLRKLISDHIQMKFLYESDWQISNSETKQDLFTL